MPSPAIEERMREYYAQRALDYERVYHKPERQADLRAMEAWLADAFVGRRVLEVACGTGWWTPHGARAAQSWLATDVNPETIAVAQAKAMPPAVRFALVDAYSFAGLDAQRFDAAFAGFWWSHVLRARLPAWLARLHERLDAGACVVMLDNRYVEGSSTRLSRRDADGNTYQLRTLDDGSTHEVLKNFPTRDEAVAALGPRARDVQWIEHPHYWMLSYALGGEPSHGASTGRIAIRRGTAADAPLLAAFAATAFRDTYLGLDDPGEIEQYVTEHFDPGAVAAALADPGSTFLLAFAASALVGYAQVRQSPPPPCVAGPSPIELARLYLAKHAMGQGLGAQLMLGAHAVARALGCRTMWLGVYDRNVRAMEFYRKLGFIEVGSKEFALGGRICMDPVMSAAVPAA